MLRVFDSSLVTVLLGVVLTAVLAALLRLAH
jgi:hypothetical protein